MCKGTAVGTLFSSLCVCLIGFVATSAEAAKVTLEKQEIYSQDGELLGFREFTAQELDSLGVGVIADYPTYVAGEVSDDDVVAFQHAATDQGILFTFHPEWDTISLNGYTFPSSGPPLGIPQDLQIDGFDGETGLYLVQLRAPPAAGWREALTRVGEVVGYYPWNTYLMRLPPAALATVRSLSVVQHVSPYQPAYKISAGLPNTDGPFDVVVALDAGQGLTQVRALLESYGAAGVSTLPGGSRALAQVQVDRDRLRTLAHRPEVLWVEPLYDIQFSGERVATIVAGQYDGSVPLKSRCGIRVRRGGTKDGCATRASVLPLEEIPTAWCTGPRWASSTRASIERFAPRTTTMSRQEFAPRGTRTAIPTSTTART